MEILFRKEFSRSFITIYKNYCLLDKNKNITNSVLNFGSHNKNTRFFVNNEKLSKDIDNWVQLSHFKTKITFNQEKIKKYFNNPFVNININDYYIRISKNGDKLTIKYYNKFLSKTINKRYFKKIIYNNYISFNLKTGNIVVINNKTFYTNNITFVIKILEVIVQVLLLNNNDNSLYNFSNVLKEYLNINITTINSIKNEILNYFVRVKKIKVNNDFEEILINYYPTEKFLKKNNRKLIASILDKFNIKSKITIKIIHEHPKFNIEFLKQLCFLFGDKYPKYLSLLSNKFFSSLYNLKFYYNDVPTNIDENDSLSIINILNDFCEKHLKYNDFIHYSMYNLIIDIFDHIKMIESLKQYLNVKFESNTFNDFEKEHKDISDKLNFIKKGKSIQYIFTQKVVDDIETPIILGDYEFYPYILKREEEYNEEGSFMHHCVANYIEREKSLIISIRNKDKSMRVTCEFNTQTGKLIQARDFCNKEPSELMLDVVSIVNVKTFKWAKLGLLHNKEKRMVLPLINGQEIKQEDRVNRTNNDIILNSLEVLPY